jgi:hypothetical protein
VGSIGRRLQGLEAARKGEERPYEIPPATLLYLKLVDNARREMDGLEPIPLTPEEEELERESERDALESLIPAMRADPGWQGEEAQAMLDEWERSARECVWEDR